MTAPPVLAFVYDRCATTNRAMLELRLAACTEHLVEHGWDSAGQFVDRGDDALTNDTRPQFDEMLRTITQAAGRERVCLMFDWGRLSHDVGHRQDFTHAALGAGAWLATVNGESVRMGAVPDGRLTGAPQVIA
ncbi:recombinase family protein [Streptomyces sp. TG1A-8]|uniref:recombinase family protein n=1 Tax=Streptomyces sp. TG1A-8 TaxID=3051385 RepID=UPI00265B72CC|nr:recombinase family protein [Streptomyces sp. TG1A-8]MDO0927288.1 recombinase family protein [Streptomyces sp. TG1A-8]